MRLFHKIVVFTTFFLVSFGISAQIQFDNATRQYKKNLPTRSVMPGAIADMDGDLTNDLIILDRGRILKWLKSSGEHFELSMMDSILMTNSKEWTMTAGDINNDGKPEIFTAGEGGPVQIVTITGEKLNKSAVPSGIYAQASNTADINNDGWLDYFLCNDRGHNRIYINDGKGKLVLSQVIDFSENDPTDGSGNYGSEWTDINGDGLIDLYISKCRAGVSDPSDLRRVNRLYINKGNGQFENQAKIFGMDYGTQTWVTAFGDLDNDGDPDAFMINHYAPHILLENIEGRYFREVELPEQLVSFGFQAVVRDLDNDGWQDVLMAGAEGTLILHNRGNWKFDITQQPLGPNKVLSFSTGDLNDDGFLDVHAHIGKPINEPGAKDDELWLNQGNGNHFIKFVLEGKKSNTSGIGSRVDIYAGGIKQTRYVKGGESYGIFNSFQQHFGLGINTRLDSVVILWPSGQKDVFTDVAANHTYLIQEGLCISKRTTLYSDELIFARNPILLDALPGFVSYQWNTGAKTQSILTETGIFHVTMTDSLGCKTISKPIKVISGCFTESTSLLNEDATIPLCSADKLILETVPAASYVWNNGETSATINVSESGKYIVQATDYCGKTLTDSVQVNVVEPQWEVKGDTVHAGQRAVLVSDHPNTNWFSDFTDEAPIFIGDTLITAALFQATSYFTSVQEIIQSRTGFTGETNFPSTNEYGANTTAGGLIFSVSSECILQAVNVFTDLPGNRRIIIRDINGNTVFAKTLFLTAGENRLVLNARLTPASRYTISTDDSLNELQFGHKGPRLVRTFNNTRFPYEIDNVLTILSSTLGAVYYYYFYDWEVIYDVQECRGEKKEVTAWVTVPSNTEEDNLAHAPDVKIIPNPSLGHVKIITDVSVQNIKILNSFGVELKGVQQLENETSFDFLPTGLYYLEVRTEKGTSIKKFIVQ